MPLAIAAVIPTRDRPSVAFAVQSVVSQEVDAHVVPVVIDDGSRAPVGPELQRRFPEVRVVRHDHPRGPAAARNAGAAAAPSDLVAFLDDDDRWLPGKLRSCLACLERHPEAGMVAHRVGYREGGAGPGRCRLIGDPVARMLHRQPPHLDGVVIRREVHDRLRFDESFQAAEDLDYLLRVALVASVLELDAVLAIHGPPGEAPSAVSGALRIEGHQRFRAAHEELFDRRARAFFDLRMGHLYRRAGRRGRAARAFVAAGVNRPLWAPPWKGLVAAALPHGAVDRVAGAPLGGSPSSG